MKDPLHQHFFGRVLFYIILTFKNLIREAEERLAEMGLDHQQTMEWFQQVHDLDTGDFWENEDHRLAIFVSPDVFRYYYLPEEFQDLVVVSDRFHLKPLLHIINNDGKFYILALSQKQVKLLEATRLVLAGVEYLFPVYKEANNYKHLVEEGITGNPENVKPEELQSQAWEIVEPLFHQKIERAVEEYKELAGNDTSKVSHDIKEIIQSAYYQRVDSLFVAVGEQHWGHFNPDTMTVDLHPEPQPDDQDMVDFAAVHTLLNGGTVYAVEPEKVPDEAPMAAILRF